MKRTLFLLLVSVLLLAACAPADPDAAASTPDASGAVDPTATAADPVDESADTPTAAPTDLPTDPTVPPVAEDDAADVDAPSNENSDDSDGGFVPATSFEDAALVRDVDWVKGAEDPVVVIIEYGDFQ